MVSPSNSYHRYFDASGKGAPQQKARRKRKRKREKKNFRQKYILQIYKTQINPHEILVLL